MNKLSDFQHLIKKHPCFCGEAHHKYGRIHLPVSPVCNIQCRFCKRCFNKTEDRPGVSRGILKPEEAVDIVRRALDMCPDITVVGIAGPGDTLATDHAIQTFELIDKEFPKLTKCLSTNGLLLKEKAARIHLAGVQTVTVTVNAFDVETLQKVCSHIVYKGATMIGEKAAQLLLDLQLEGIREIAKYGTLIKINTVLIPGINDGQIKDIARVTSEAGAAIMNIIPLIPQHELKYVNAPNCDELQKARTDAEEYLDVFRHCKHCRADAAGVPGKGIDISKKLYENLSHIQVENTFSHG